MSVYSQIETSPGGGAKNPEDIIKIIDKSVGAVTEAIANSLKNAEDFCNDNVKRAEKLERKISNKHKIDHKYFDNFVILLDILVLEKITQDMKNQIFTNSPSSKRCDCRPKGPWSELLNLYLQAQSFGEETLSMMPSCKPFKTRLKLIPNIEKLVTK
jgi:hypothetical protein